VKENVQDSLFTRHRYLGVLIVFFLLTNFGWIAKDTRPWPVIDCYGAAVNVMRAMGQDPAVKIDTLSSFLSHISRGGRPPLYQLCTVPFVALFGYSEDAFLAVNLALLVIMFVAMYNVGAELNNRLAGVVAAVAVACFPPIVHILRQYRSYSGALAFVAVTLWALFVLINRRSIYAAWASATAATIAILMHPMAVFVLFLPMASTWLWLFFQSPGPQAHWNNTSWHGFLRERFRAHLFLKGLLPAAGLPVLFVIGWYASYGQANLDTFKILNADWISSFRGHGKTVAGFLDFPTDYRWLALTSPHMISLPLAVFSGFFTIWLLFRRGATGRLLSLWIIAAYLGVGVYIHVLNWQYGAFLLPILGAILALPGKNLSIIVSGLILFFSFANYSFITWGAPHLPSRLEHILGLWWDHSQLALCHDAPVVQYYPYGSVVSSVNTKDRTDGKNSVAVFVGAGLNARSFQFISLRFWPHRRMTFIQTGSQQWGTPFPVKTLLYSQWFVVRTDLPRWYWMKSQPNHYTRATTILFRDPPKIFRESLVEAGRFPWPGEGDVVLYRRIRPPSLEEMDAIVAALDLEPRYVTQSSLIAAELLKKSGQPQKALERLEKAGAIVSQPPQLRARILAEAAGLLMEEGRFKEAAQHAREATHLDPGNLQAKQLLAGMVHESS